MGCRSTSTIQHSVLVFESTDQPCRGAGTSNFPEHLNHGWSTFPPPSVLTSLRPRCRCSAIPSVLIVKRKCPHEGTCDIDAERADKTPGTQQLIGRAYDHGAGSDTDGTEHTPRQAHSGGIQEGAAVLAHGNRGRRPSNAMPDALAKDVVLLACTRYAGVNHTHLSGLLREYEGIDMARNTLRNILTDAGVTSPRRRRPPKHRARRRRMAREGMLIQIDGSYHRWLGEDGPQFTLPLAVDDATGCVANALFCELENTRSYFLLMGDLIRRHGVPIALYSGRHAVFKHTPSSEATSAPTQFSRAMDELGVQLIFAHSPQAKGRVERTAGTLQDRLVTELRLARATIDEANNRSRNLLVHRSWRFTRRLPPSLQSTLPGPGTAHRSRLSHPRPTAMPRHNPLPEVQRRVARDNTVKYRWHTLQLLPGKDRPSYAGAAVDAMEGSDGQLSVQHEGRVIPSQEAPQRPNILRSFNRRTVHTPVFPLNGNGKNGSGRVRKTITPRRRKPTPLQTARWRAVQRAKRQGLSIRGIARKLGIHRTTVRKHMEAKSPPVSPARTPSKVT